MAKEANWIFDPKTITEKLNGIIDNPPTDELTKPPGGFPKRWKVFIEDSIGLETQGTGLETQETKADEENKDEK